MLTTTAAFDKYNMRGNIASSYIVKITGGSTTFYFSDRIIDLSGSSIKTQGVVLSFGTLNQKIDLFKKTSSISNVKLKLVNAPYSVSTTGAGSVCLSDVLAADNIFNATVEIYFWYEGIIKIDDCLKLFDGLAQPITKANPEYLELNILDNSVLYHRTVPTVPVDRATFTNAPKASIGKYLPLIYGAFALDDDLDGNLSECVWIGPTKVVVSDHVMDAVDNVWIYDEDFEEIVKVDSGDYTVTLDDSGRTTIVFDEVIEATLTAYLYPETMDIEHVDDPAYIYPDADKAYAHDKDDTTSIEASVGTYSPNGEEDHDYIDNIFGRFKNYEPVGDHVSVYVEVKFDNDNDTTHGLNYRAFWIDSSSTAVGNLIINSNDPATYNSHNITGAWNSASLTLQDITYPNALRFQTKGYFREGSGRNHIADLYEIRMRVIYKRSIETNMRIFIEGVGREFGSWIDEGGRSNSYNEGDLIENPAHIIESILRDELGLTASDVDVASFDSVGSDLSSWDMIMTINTAIRTDNLFASIGFQSKAHVLFDSQGTAKIGILNASGTSSDSNFDKDDIQRAKIFLTQGDMKQLINSVDIFYYPGIDGDFRKITSAINSSSITTYGITKHKTIRASFIHDDTVATSFENYFISSSGYWKDLQEILEVTMANFKFIPWEIGDIIHPNSDIDDIIRLFNDNFGTPANAPLFLITEKKIGKDLKFKMARMGETGGA